MPFSLQNFRMFLRERDIMPNSFSKLIFNYNTYNSFSGSVNGYHLLVLKIQKIFSLNMSIKRKK